VAKTASSPKTPSNSSLLTTKSPSNNVSATSPLFCSTPKNFNSAKNNHDSKSFSTPMARQNKEVNSYSTSVKSSTLTTSKNNSKKFTKSSPVRKNPGANLSSNSLLSTASK
jgi:hypothetical protein